MANKKAMIEYDRRCLLFHDDNDDDDDYDDDQ